MTKRPDLRKAFKGAFESTDTPDERAPDTQEPPSRVAGVFEEPVRMVPGGNGKMVPADQPVNLTFTVTAEERYYWNLELSKRGMKGVSVLRKVMREFIDKGE